MDLYESVRALWQGRHIGSVAALDEALHSYRILFAYHSGKIENDDITYHDTREIFENGKVNGYTGDPRALFEQQNQKLCYDFLKHKIVAKEPLTSELVLEVHGILTSGTYDERRFVERGERPGAYKKHDYVTGRQEVGHPPGQVDAAVKALLDEVNSYRGSSVLRAAAYFHVRFEYIHPFTDGNGRVGRTLLNYYLMTRDEPPAVIHDEDKKQYYGALERYDTDEELEPMAAFIKAQTVKTWEKALERTNGTAPPNHRKLSDNHKF